MKEWAGWASSVAVTAALFAGGAAAALRVPERLTSGQEPFAVAMDISVASAPAARAATASADAPIQPETPLQPEPAVEPEPEPLPVAEPVKAAEDTATPAPPAPVALPAVQTADAIAPVREQPSPKAQKPKPPAKKAAISKQPVKQQPKAPAKRAAAAAPAGGSASPSKPAAVQKKAGGADPASYAQSVLRKITKLSRKSSVGKGKAIVGFEIAADGGLKQVMILSTSGSAALDKLAMDQIRRAAPFGAPPAGAQRKFSCEFVGK